MNKEEIESPYCEICGHCGEIGCCGIRNFISEHIEGKTNCKNEEWVINDLINLCEYKDEVFEENKQLKFKWKILKEYINNLHLDSQGIITRIKDKIEVIESSDSNE